MFMLHTKRLIKPSMCFLLICLTAVSAQNPVQNVGYVDMHRVYNQTTKGHALLNERNHLSAMVERVNQIQHHNKLTEIELKEAAAKQYNLAVSEYNDLDYAFNQRVAFYTEKIRSNWNLSQVYQDLSQAPVGSQYIDITDSVIELINELE